MTPKPKKLDSKAAAGWIVGGVEELKNQTPAQRGLQRPAEEKPKPRKRERFTVNLAPDLIEWARRAVVFTPGQSLTGLMEEALTHELERLEKKQGAPYPATTATPKKGRPITLKG